MPLSTLAWVTDGRAQWLTHRQSQKPPVVVLGFSMDLPNILNSKGPGAAAAAAEQQLQQHLVEVAHGNGRSYSETGSERGVSPQSRSGQTLHDISLMANAGQYASSPHLQQSMPMLSDSFLPQDGGSENGYDGQQGEQVHGGPRSSDSGVTKAFACSTCKKGFARRSDLARHGMQNNPVSKLEANCPTTERIHTGVRPHVCDYPGCNKQFIQRSALTVHARVHTGEKPHMCEHCTKVRGIQSQGFV